MVKGLREEIDALLTAAYNRRDGLLQFLNRDRIQAGTKTEGLGRTRDGSLLHSNCFEAILICESSITVCGSAWPA